jgi:hypothetical protein
MYFVKKLLDGTPCTVYFFKRWTTYEHPVKPQDPIPYAEALQLNGYCRAWMCESGGSEQFLLLEAIRNNLELTSIKKEHPESNTLEFYDYHNDKAGAKLTDGITLDRERFLTSLPNSDDYLSLITSSLGYKYRYHYDSNGKLKKVKITDMDGNVKALNY